MDAASKAQKYKRPSGEDTAECSTFFMTIQNKRTRRILIYSVFYKEKEKPGNGFPCAIPTVVNMHESHEYEYTGGLLISQHQ